MFKEEKELWVKFACAALSGCACSVEYRTNTSNSGVAPELWIDEEDMIDDDCKFAAEYADKMLDLFKDKFRGC